MQPKKNASRRFSKLISDDDYKCPRTKQFFFDPVRIETGARFEREAIMDYINSYLQKGKPVPVPGKEGKEDLTDDEIIHDVKALIPDPQFKKMVDNHITTPEQQENIYRPRGLRERLVSAFKNEDTYSVKDLLVRQDPRMIKEKFEGKTVLDLACEQSDPSLLNYIIDLLGVSEAKESLHARYKSEDFFKYILSLQKEAGVHVIAKARIWDWDVSFYQLQAKEAFMSEDLIRLQHCVNLGASIAILFEGKNTLHVALEQQKMVIAKWLIENGFDITAVDEKGNTALHILVANENESLTQLLLNKGINDKVDMNGNTALHIAVQKGNQKIVKLLIDAGLDINAVNKDKNTALHLAAERGDIALAELLLDNKAQGKARNSANLTAAGVARLAGKADVSDAIEKRRRELSHELLLRPLRAENKFLRETLESQKQELTEMKQLLQLHSNSLSKLLQSTREPNTIEPVIENERERKDIELPDMFSNSKEVEKKSESAVEYLNIRGLS